MNAEGLLKDIAKAINEAKLDAVMIGNAAAAIQGAPVTTVDIDFMIRDTELNVKKLLNIADALGCGLLDMSSPTVNMFRIVHKEEPIQLDFLFRLTGVKSFAGLRSRSDNVKFGSYALQIASLEDIIRSKEVANRPKDQAVLPTLKEALNEKNRCRKNEPDASEDFGMGF